MQLLDRTLTTPAQNLALDEALLDEAEAGDGPCEVLRLWEPAEPMVVVGRSSRIEVEVNVDFCRARGIPVLRRSSGGAAILAGPGCLMYAVVLSYQRQPELRAIDQAHRFVLDTIATALGSLATGVRRRGTSDLALGERKFSGNSMRCKRSHFLYHGTLLYDLPLELLAQALGTPPRQPEYRLGRSHESFVMNLPVTATALRDALARTWSIDEICSTWPGERVEQLVAEKYGRQEWNDHSQRVATNS